MLATWGFPGTFAPRVELHHVPCNKSVDITYQCFRNNCSFLFLCCYFKRGPERKRQLTSTNKYWYFFGLGRPQSNGMWIQHPGITNFISKWSFPTCCVGELAKQGTKCTFGTHGGWMFFHDRRLLSAWFYLERFHHGWWKRSWHLSSIL